MEKEFEALENIFNVIYSKPTTYDEDLSLNVDRKIIENCLKAFEIIKEKKIDVVNLSCSLDAESYNLSIEILGLNDSYKITQEEFNLLKEVL
jgi:hypothetical protein